MSRKYQGRHRALPVSPLQSARVALPALAAASLTVAAAGTAAATDVGSQAPAKASAGFKDTTQWTRQSTAGISRSSQRSSVVKAKATASAKAKNRAAVAAKARLAREGQARRAALGALSGNDTEASSYTQPAPKPQPELGADGGSTDAVSARGSKTSDSTVSGSSERKSKRWSQRSSARSSERSRVSRSDSSRSDSSRSDSSDYQAPRSSGSGWVSPVSGGTFTSGFGYRWGRMHNGVDYAVSSGTPLRAMNNGVVVAAGWYGGQGKRIVVRFANGTEAHYAHMSSFAVSAGQQVGAGQTIGFSGNTGNSTGPHLHLEIHVGGSPINPSGWLRSRGL